MPTLNREHRRLLENTVAQARAIAEEGARKVLADRYAVHHHEPWPHMTPDERELRNQLRAHGRQLGDQRDNRRDTQETEHLAQACAYEHWHRMLFARFLAENDLLLDAEHGMTMTLDEVREMAREQGRDWFDIAADLAQRMLLSVFRPDDPVLRVSLPQETNQKLDKKLGSLPSEIFRADDSLGWVYQFWQSDEKDRVNKSELKIGADELSSVTQLFTEDYMVLFLLENTLGAWWTAQRVEQGKAPALPGYTWAYLRLNDDGSPAAGRFDKWPRAARDLRVLDPSMGSGHFLTFALPLLVRMRIEEEGLSLQNAISRVLRDNLFGLELDARCSQIAAFNLALAAWRLAGEHFALPELNLACSGLGIHAAEGDWVRLAGDDSLACEEMRRLYSLFKDAPTLGSLIDPLRLQANIYAAGAERVLPLLEEALGKEEMSDDSRELIIAAQGVLAAFQILAARFTLVVTNVPYLGRGKQDYVLAQYCGEFHADAKGDLATSFIDRCLRFCQDSGSVALVTPQNWLFLTGYKQMRDRLFKSTEWNVVARLGARAFEMITGEIVNVALLCLTKRPPRLGSSFPAMDVSASKNPAEKQNALRINAMVTIDQLGQLANPDHRLILEGQSGSLSNFDQFVSSYQGAVTGDLERFTAFQWEVLDHCGTWEPFRTAVGSTSHDDGLMCAIRWENGSGSLARYARETRDQLHDMHESGQRAWGKKGIAINRMKGLLATPYEGVKFDNNVAVLIPEDPRMMVPILYFCQSEDFVNSVRSLDQTLKVTNQTLRKVSFDLKKWQEHADAHHLAGIPVRQSSDPTQWVFSGDPNGADYPLQVGVARLLGYRWPCSRGFSLPDHPELGPDTLNALADVDGIVCLSSVSGEASAGDRLRALLAAAYGDRWAATLLAQLLKGAESLETWLRDVFFEEHCRVFCQRPFILHVWDGRKDGFHALVNYHKLTMPNGEGRKTLEKLIYTSLGDWIKRQSAEVTSGIEGADGRLAAASHLKVELEKIHIGEKPYDIFVRWKPLHEQSLGWEPDMNDGVRLNIRPWLTTTLAPTTKPKKGACVLRVTPKGPSGKDRGKEPQRSKQDFPWLWSWDEQADNFEGGDEFDGARWNDLHYSLDAKKKARERKAGRLQ